MNEIREKLKALVASGYSQQAIADQVSALTGRKCSQATISRIMSGVIKSATWETASAIQQIELNQD